MDQIGERRKDSTSSSRTEHDAPTSPQGDVAANDPKRSPEYRQLEAELQETRDFLQCSIADLEASAHELESSNQEVMSINEELRVTNEELQTSTEELTAVNDELVDKCAELEDATNDLNNLLDSTDVATLLLDSELRIRRFTPTAVELFRLIARDLGRHIGDLAFLFDDPAFYQDAAHTLDSGERLEREVRSHDDKWYLRRTLPYFVAGEGVRGVVVAFSDVTKLKRLTTHLSNRERQQAVVAELGRKAASGAAIDDLLNAAAADIAETLGADFCKVLQLLPQGAELKLVAGVGWRPGLVGVAKVPTATNSQAGYTLTARAPVIVDDLSDEQRFTGPELLTQHRVRSGVSVIIGAPEEPWGVLGVHTRSPRRFNVDDVNFVQSVANLLASAIARFGAESATERALAEVTTLYNSAPVGLALQDVNLRYLRVNDRLAEINGLSPQEHVGKLPHEVIPVLAEVAEPLQRRVLQTGEPVIGAEIRGERPSQPGVEGVWFVSYLPLRFGDEIIGLNIVVQEITELKIAERALRESEERLQLALTASTTGVWERDIRTGQVYWSWECQKIMGVAEAVETYQLAQRLVYPDDLEENTARTTAIIETGRPDSWELRIVRPDGAIRWLAACAMLQSDTEGRPQKLIGVLNDVTEQKLAEKRLCEQRDELAHVTRMSTMGEMAAGIAHELNQPLTAIANQSFVLERALGGLETPQMESLIGTNRIVREQALRAASIVRRLRGFLTKSPPKRTANSLNAVVSESLKLLQHELRDKGIELRMQLVDDELAVWVDTVQIQQVIVNLVRNSIDAMQDCPRSERRLVISSHPLGTQEVEIVVDDNGHGLDEQTLASLFDAFFTTKSDGMGMGLPISHGIVEAHSGQLIGEAKAGRGAIFRVRLPRLVTEQR